MKTISFVLFFLISYNAYANSVIEVSPSQNRAIIKTSNKITVGESLIYTDKFNESCIAKVLSTNEDTYTLDISECPNKVSIKSGAEFLTQNQAVNNTSSSNSSGLPTINESWYTLWGIGISSISYDKKDLNTAFANADSNGADRLRLFLDLFGFYWPSADHRSLHGFIASSVADSLTEDSTEITINQLLYSYSYHHYFGQNIGAGWYLRADAGLARHVLRIKGVGVLDQSEYTDWGTGLLFGGGYGFSIGEETRALVGLYYSIRSAEDLVGSSTNLTLGFLF